MFRLGTVLLVAGLTIGIGLAQKPAVPFLTEADIAEGWIALFDGETSFGWTSAGDAKWGVAGNTLQCVGGGVGSLVTTSQFADFELGLEFLADASARGGIAVRCPSAGPVTPANSYLVTVGDDHPQWPTGSISGLVRSNLRRPTAGKWTDLRVRCEGRQIAVRINGRPSARLNNDALKAGSIALVYGGSGSIRVRNVRLLPLGMGPLFNGKDLTGWQTVSGTQATYSVTREGWLNVRNGRGDLQTTQSFGDFVLQLEAITHGQHLNSGIFFRANPGGFWSGYEVQIRNQWTGEDRGSPVDFGTGGIYNRQPARRVVSDDNEWFALTLVARGPRMATWVNGYQVTDFLDTREPDQTNARRGMRTEPGVISIQGHDPSTNLSFRKIRIAEFPQAQPQKR